MLSFCTPPSILVLAGSYSRAQLQCFSALLSLLIALSCMHTIWNAVLQNACPSLRRTLHIRSSPAQRLCCSGRSAYSGSLVVISHSAHHLRSLLQEFGARYGRNLALAAAEIWRSLLQEFGACCGRSQVLKTPYCLQLGGRHSAPGASGCQHSP